MKITKQGIEFRKDGDVLIWLWWWVRKGCVWKSIGLDKEFSSLKEYWMDMGRQSEAKFLQIPRISGISLEKVIDSYIKFNHSIGCFVVLYDINPEAKPASFWRTIPENCRDYFKEDVILLKCKDYAEVCSLCNSLERSFCFARGYRDGIQLRWN